ncbi:TPA: ATP-binding protein [Salmonella enterica subsp. enterica serovar Blitta]|nr:ATP-binding protein [Salmonella enterica subsp. enterica serovar Blitta]HDC2544476.1 ATP-binding protein [Salmonella enterica]HDC2560377.1 ATP-binding protein [Salmonella enterica]
MAEIFDEMRGRMDALTAKRFGVTVSINGADCIAVESDFLAEFGPVEGNGKNLVIFTRGITPRKGDTVVFRGRTYTANRIRRFNGKPQITLEEDDGG